ncbi:MAG: efflux RND transporter periplasmic adaptor subunit [Paludibacteraceae bacterium]|jgi:membrane fusion protein (multidrug efflux system)|nr:efflux RND transporter periplasmic adaptor subunit [Paludibacteraceae bacterium]
MFMKKLMGFVALATLLVSCGGGSQGKPDFSDNEYAVRTIGASDANLETTYPATFKGMQDVEIRPKVSGFITKIYVKEGQQVGAGQVLFQIDNVTYRAAVNQAQAAVNAAQSQLNTAKLTYENAQKLHEKNVIGEYELQSTRNQYESAQAALGQAKASLMSAREQLSFCTVKSPTAGVVGSLPYKVGALVSASMQQPFTTISNGSNVDVYFSLNEKEVMELVRKEGSLQAAIATMPAVKLQLADGTIYGSEGKVVKASGVVDATTGSVSLIAAFPNPQKLIKSGGSGKIVMPYQATGAIIIPQDACVEVQDKYFVYKVGKDNKVKYSEITIDTQNDGQNYIVTSGLSKGERIVVYGVNMLQEGMEIKPISEADYAKKMKKAEELSKVQGDGVFAVAKALKS